MTQSKSFLFAAFCGVLSIFSLSSFLMEAVEEYGKAGYYADSLHGRNTKSGEKYDKNKFTCAHMTLPFGTKIRVTRLDNDRSVVVTVNDRGKFVEGYIVDLSRAAAEQIDLIQKGVARVKVEVIEDAPMSKKSSAKNVASASKRAVESDSEEMASAATHSLAPVEYSMKRKIAKGSLVSPKVAPLAPVEHAFASEAAAANSTLFKVDLKKITKNGFGVQVCTLDDADNVLPIIQKLEKHFPNKVVVASAKDNDENVSYKVFVGPSKDKKAALADQRKVAKYYKQTFVVDLSEI
jgi:rare lipoprotein A